MQLARTVRRFTAVLGATALVTASGVASRLWAGDPGAATPAGITPSVITNNTSGATTFTIVGSGFNQLLDSVSLVPTVVNYANETKAISAPVDKANSSSTKLIVTATIT